MMDESDSLVQCPYNKSHILYQSRLQTHLVKCKFAHLNPQQNVEPIVMKNCKFNSNHHFPPHEIEEHEKNCPDIGTLARFLHTNDPVGSAIPYKTINLPPTDENWDDDECVSTYNPEEHACSSVIIRAKQGVPKSMRKNFRMQERERINRLRENQEALEKSGRVSARAKPEVVENTAFSENRLRQPKSNLLGMGRGRVVKTGQQQYGAAEAMGHGRGQGLQDVPPMQVRAPCTVGSSSLSSGSSSPVSVEHCTELLSNTSFGDDDDFVEQRSKRNRKKKEPVSGVRRPMGRGAGNPLMTSNGQLETPIPGLSGRGRGRLTSG